MLIYGVILDNESDGRFGFTQNRRFNLRFLCASKWLLECSIIIVVPKCSGLFSAEVSKTEPRFESRNPRPASAAPAIPTEESASAATVRGPSPDRVVALGPGRPK